MLVPESHSDLTFTVNSGKHFIGLVMSMATQFQGPRGDPHALYEYFWQGPPQPRQKDDLILQVCHDQPSDTQLRPRFFFSPL